MLDLKKVAFPEYIKSLQYVNLSTINYVYPTDIRDISEQESFFPEHRHRRHHHNRVLQPAKEVFTISVKDNYIGPSTISSLLDASPTLNNEGMTERQKLNVRQVGK